MVQQLTETVTVGRFAARGAASRHPGALRYTVERDGEPVPYDEALTDLGDELGDLFTHVIRTCPFEAVFFETPRVSGAPLEFVLVDSPTLARRPVEPEPFAHEMHGAEVATFPNLGGDAWLVVPAARAAHSAYGHLAAFVRGAPEDQVRAVWAASGTAIRRWRSDRGDPVWFSTSGLGVTWVHLRLDERPKYITYAPYRHVP
jgi:hypothetical protein